MTESPPLSPDDVAAEARSARRFVMLLIVVAAAAMSFAQVLTSQPLQSANDRSRWATVWSLVERGTYQIDEIDALPAWSTIDKVRQDEHFYSSKPPLQSTLVAGVYWVVKRVTGRDLLNHTAEASRLILLIVNWLPHVVSLWVMVLLLERTARRDFGKYFVLLATSWGTLLLPFSSSLNNHFPAAISVLCATYPLLRVLHDDERRKRYFVLAGFFSGLTFCFELPAALLVVVFGALLLKADARRTLTVFVPAALIPVAAFVVTNVLVVGSPLPFYSSYGSDKYVYEHEGVPSYWSNPQGLDRNLDSPLMYFVNCTVGHHGLLSLTPMFVLTWIGWLRCLRWRDTRHRTILAVGAMLTVVTLGFYLTRTQNYNYGGNSVALRWMLWLVPLWLIAMIPVLDQWGANRKFQFVAAGLLAASIASAVWPGGNPWQHPWLFTAMERCGWIDYDMPAPKTFESRHVRDTLWSWFPKLGEPQVAGEMFVTLAGTGTALLGNDFAGSLPGETRLTLRTQSKLGRPRKAAPFPQTVSFTWSSPDDQDSRQIDVVIDANAFAIGAKSSKFLCSPTGDKLSLSDLMAAQRLVSGLPQAMEFRSGHIRYLKTPLRPKKAFRCQRAAAQTLFQPKHSDHALRYRCDVWLCDEIPFGVAQLELSVTDPSTGQTLAFQRLTAVAASGLAD